MTFEWNVMSELIEDKDIAITQLTTISRKSYVLLVFFLLP